MQPIRLLRPVLWLFIGVVAGCFSIGCAGERVTGDMAEVEAQAAALQEALFVEREGRWLGLDSHGDAWRLVELDRPSKQIVASKVSSSERADGVSERYIVSFHCSQFRFWDEAWTGWRRAPGGGPSKKILGAISPTGAGFRNYTLEKRAGRWSVRGVAPWLEFDRVELARLISVAFD
jgi:hypothetical protein